MKARVALLLAIVSLALAPRIGLAWQTGSEFALPPPPGAETYGAAETGGASAFDSSAFELAARSAHTHNNYDPLVDVATPQGSPPPEYGPQPGGSNWVSPQAESPWVHLGLYGNCFYWIYGGPNYFSPPPPGPPPAGSKSGMLQRLTFTETWLSSGNNRRDMGVNDLEFKSTLALPLGCLATPLVLTPGFGAHFFDGPLVTDVPGHTYDAYLDIRWMRQISPRVAIDLGVTPGWYSDFEQSDSDALRIGARGVALITCSPAFQIALGAVYLDRDDVPVLPLGGVIWLPNEDTKVELLLPRPKISRRLGYDCNTSHWAYIAGEFGGGSWAIERANGDDDVFNYRDYRFLFGVERNSLYGVSGRLEAGYVFGREIQYQSKDRDISLDSTLLLRAEISR